MVSSVQRGVRFMNGEEGGKAVLLCLFGRQARHKNNDTHRTPGQCGNGILTSRNSASP